MCISYQSSWQVVLSVLRLKLTIFEGMLSDHDQFPCKLHTRFLFGGGGLSLSISSIRTRVPPWPGPGLGVDGSGHTTSLSLFGKMG